MITSVKGNSGIAGNLTYGGSTISLSELSDAPGTTGPMGMKGEKGDPGPTYKLIVSGNGIGLQNEDGVITSWVPLDGQSFNTYAPPVLSQHQVVGLEPILFKLQELVNHLVKQNNEQALRIKALEKWTQI